LEEDFLYWQSLVFCLISTQIAKNFASSVGSLEISNLVVQHWPRPLFHTATVIGTLHTWQVRPGFYSRTWFHHLIGKSESYLVSIVVS